MKDDKTKQLFKGGEKKPNLELNQPTNQPTNQSIKQTNIQMLIPNSSNTDAFGSASYRYCVWQVGNKTQ